MSTCMRVHAAWTHCLWVHEESQSWQGWGHSRSGWNSSIYAQRTLVQAGGGGEIVTRTHAYFGTHRRPQNVQRQMRLQEDKWSERPLGQHARAHTHDGQRGTFLQLRSSKPNSSTHAFMALGKAQVYTPTPTPPLPPHHEQAEANATGNEYRRISRSSQSFLLHTKCRKNKG